VELHRPLRSSQSASAGGGVVVGVVVGIAVVVRAAVEDIEHAMLPVTISKRFSSPLHKLTYIKRVRSSTRFNVDSRSIRSRNDIA